MAEAVIVVGRQGCGKTRCAIDIAQHFGLNRIIDDAWPPHAVQRGDLVLTNCRPASVPGFAMVVEFDELVAEHPEISRAIRA